MGKEDLRHRVARNSRDIGRNLQSARDIARRALTSEPSVGGFHPQDHIPPDQEITLFFPDANAKPSPKESIS